MRSVWSRSFLDERITRWFFLNIRFVIGAARSLGSTLDSTMKWITRQKFPCNCYRYPSWWPRRHGHICVSSLEYSGKFKQTLNSIMNCKVRATSSAQEVYDCVRETWCKYFPRDLMPDLPNFEMHSSESGSPLDISKVVSTARYLRHLRVVI